MANPTPSLSPHDANFVPLPLVSVSVLSGTLTNSTTASAVQFFTTPTACRWVDVSCYSTNLNNVAVGPSNVSAEGTSGTRTGVGTQITKNTTWTFRVSDASMLYLAVASVNDGVAYTVYK